MLILQTSFAQKTEVNWGFENKFVKNQRSQNIIGENDDFLFTFNLRPKGLFRKETFSFFVLILETLSKISDISKSMSKFSYGFCEILQSLLCKII